MRKSLSRKYGIVNYYYPFVGDILEERMQLSEQEGKLLDILVELLYDLESHRYDPDYLYVETEDEEESSDESETL